MQLRLGIDTLKVEARWARLTPCDTWRYLLGRRWAEGPALRWVMLNPSTADADIDDPTIRRVARFTRDAGYAAAIVANLYALRATNPADLAAHPDPVGPENDTVLGSLTRAAGDTPIVAAWGNNAPPDRVRAVLSGPLHHARLHCLGTTKGGQPRHPLYVPADQPLGPWSDRWRWAR